MRLAKKRALTIPAVIENILEVLQVWPSEEPLVCNKCPPLRSVRGVIIFGFRPFRPWYIHAVRVHTRSFEAASTRASLYSGSAHTDEGMARHGSLVGQRHSRGPKAGLASSCSLQAALRLKCSMPVSFTSECACLAPVWWSWPCA